MKKSRIALGFLICTATLSLQSCATSNLWRWGFDRTSKIDEPSGAASAAVIKPTCTFLFTPPAVAWDVVSVIPQWLFGVYPYGDKHMVPDATGTDGN